MARKRRAASNWIIPVLVGIATLLALVIAKAELGKLIAVSAAIALLVYVAVVFFARRKIH